MVGQNSAAIDLGTNSCRLLITNTDGIEVYSKAISTCLGKGMTEKNCFTDAAIKRNLQAFGKFAKIIRQNNVRSYRAIATAACRSATNGRQFVAMVKKTCGINLEIIDGEEEALLTLRGAVMNADKKFPYVIVYDLGGGSTEITLATNTKHPQILHTLSIPWGSRTAAEKFDLIEYDAEKAHKLVAEIKKYTDIFIKDSNLAHYLPECCCVATSSPALRIMSMIKQTKTYDRCYVDGLSANTEDFDKAIADLFKMNFTQMRESPYIGKNRATIFVAGGIIFQTIYKNLHIKKITSSLKGAMEAICAELREQ